MDHEPTQEEFTDLFSDYGVTLYREESIPAVITDASARFALSRMGLPLTVSDSMMFNSEEPDIVGLETLAVAYQEELPADVAELFVLGVWREQFMALDGTDGRVLLVEDGRVTGALASNLRRFLTVVYLARKTLDERVQESDETLEEILIPQFVSIDPVLASTAKERWCEMIRSIRYDD